MIGTRIVLVFCAFFIAVSATEAQQVQEKKVSGFVESWNAVSDSGTVPEINVYAQGPLKGKLGWTAWTLTTEEWSEALLGVTYAPSDWMEVSYSLGLESNSMPLRQGASVWIGKGNWSLLTIEEYGGSGLWYRVLGTYKASETILVGVNSHRGFGTGPYVSKSFGKFSLWATYALIGDTLPQGVVSARFSF